MKKYDRIYLDYSATTPVDPRVLEEMLPFFSQDFGNPTSIHQFGQAAEGAVENARQTISSWLNCGAEEIVFTSCGTESDNLALRGVSLQARETRGANHLLISPVEHAAVTKTAEELAAHFDFEVEYLPVDQYGRVNPQSVQERLRTDTALVSIIYANNEIGTVNPIPEIGAVCRKAGIPLHTDAVQAGAYLDLDVRALNVDLLSLGAHKFYGPKGVGALYIRRDLDLLPVQTGGSQESARRAGTHNVPYIVGMAAALEIAQSERLAAYRRLSGLRDSMVDGILKTIPGARLTGHPDQRLPNHASFVFSGADGNSLLMMLDLAGYACSSGSACKTGSPEPSSVLLALGLEPDLALGSLRITLGRWTDDQQIETFVHRLPEIIAQNRLLQKPNLAFSA
jgi:cysteine desulfurase